MAPFEGIRRGRMPRVAATAAALLLVSLLLGDTALLRETWLGDLLGVALVVTLLLTLIYYVPRLARRLVGVLLWRVRRRLIVTYLFVGLTPIVLLLVLGMIAGFGISAQALARLVTGQLDLMTRQSAAAARALASEVPDRLRGADEARLRAWLRERAAALQAALPGARLALWCCGEEGAGEAGAGRARHVVSPPDPDLRPLGGDPAPPGEPLPSWLRGRPEWSGAVYCAGAEDGEDGPASVHLRALARGRAPAGGFAVLVDVPVSAALVRLLADATALDLRMLADSTRVSLRVSLDEEELRVGGVPASTDGGAAPEEAVPRAEGARATPARLPYLVVLPTTDWRSGERGDRTLFAFDWSWEAAVLHILGGSFVGRVWQYVVAGVGLVFLALELLAVLAAAWMTRAVTGTVHQLHRATEHIRRGDFSFRARIGSRDQLGELAEAFNDMSASIEALLRERVERERLEREVEIAAEVQARLFPRWVPRLSTAEIAGACRAARGVAGDYYDYLELGPGRLALALGDVTGKGISASLLMSNLQASLRALAGPLAGDGAGGAGAPSLDAQERSARAPASPGPGPAARVVSAVNEQLCRSTDVNRFATLFLAIYDDRDRELRYTRAGHGPALLARPDGTVERLEAGGTVVGAFEGARYEEARAVLEPGALLVLYSDGLSEARNPAGEEFGVERLARGALDNRERPAEEALRALFAAVDAWTGEREREDDQTLVVLKTR